MNDKTEMKNYCFSDKTERNVHTLVLYMPKFNGKPIRTVRSSGSRHPLSSPSPVGINLRGVDVGMPKKFACRVDVCPGCQGHCGESVTAILKKIERRLHS